MHFIWLKLRVLSIFQNRPSRPLTKVCKSNASFCRDDAAKSWEIITSKVVRGILKKSEGLA